MNAFFFVVNCFGVQFARSEMDRWPGGREEGLLICKQETTNYAQHAEQAEQGGVRDPKSLLVRVTGTSSTRKDLSPRPLGFPCLLLLCLSRLRETTGLPADPQVAHSFFGVPGPAVSGISATPFESSRVSTVRPPPNTAATNSTPLQVRCAWCVCCVCIRGCLD
jgi:hypothetical protein